MTESQDRTYTLVDPRAYYHAKCHESNVPPQHRPELVEYIVAHKPTGKFLAAVLRNDLLESVLLAEDEDTQQHLIDIVFFLYNYAPIKCWKSVELHNAWVK